MRVYVYLIFFFSVLSVEAQVTAPWTEDFESFIAPDTFANGWTRSNTDTTWTVNSGFTSSLLTGPAFDNTLGEGMSGQYVYTEANQIQTGEEFILISPIIDVNDISCVYLTFNYHMFGVAINSLNVDVRTSTTSEWTENVFSLIGQQQTSSEEAWRKAYVNLSPSIGDQTSVQLRFRVVRGFTFRGDVALDDVSIIDGSGIFQANPTSLIAPESNVCALDTTNEVTVSIFNESCTDIAPGSTILQTIVNGPISYLLRDTINTVIGSSDSIEFTLDSIIDLSVPGDYIFSFSLENIDGTTNVSTIPFFDNITNFTITGEYEENFESFQFGSSSNNLGWVDVDGFGGFVTANNTPSFNTGPGFDNTPSGSLFIYAEAFETAQDSFIAIESPCIDISDLESPILTYYYYMFGREIGNLFLDITTDDGATYTTIDSVIAEQQLTEFSPWEQKRVPLLPVAEEGLVKFRFRAQMTGSDLSDIAIDDFSIIDTCLFDIQLDEIFIPPSNCGLSADATLSVEVNNLNCEAINNIPLVAVVNGDTIRETLPFLDAQESIRYDFNTEFDLSADTVFEVTFFHEVVDSASQNNLISTRFFNFSVPPPAIPQPNTMVCLNDSTVLTATGTNIQWVDSQSGDVLAEGDTLRTGALTTDTSFLVFSRSFAPATLSTDITPGAFTCGGRQTVSTMFDVTALQSTIFIDSFDINVGFGEAIVDVYFARRTYVGIENTPIFWNFGQPFMTDTVQGQGVGNPTTIALDTSILVPFGETYGILIVTREGNLIRVTGDGGNNIAFTDAERLVELNAGLVICDRPFNGFFNTGFQFNGNMHFRALRCSSAPRRIDVEVPILDLGEDFNFGCGFGANEIRLNADVNVPATYAWSTSDTVPQIDIRSSGIYWVSVTPEGCDTQIDTVAGDLVELDFDFSIAPDTTTFEPRFNITVDLLGETDVTSIVWQTNPIQRDTTAVGLLPGEYVFTLRNDIGCTVTDTIFVPDEFNGGLPGLFGNIDFVNVFPNPVDDILTIRLQLRNRDSGTFKLYSAQGQLVDNVAFQNFTDLRDYQLNLDRLSPGIYLLAIQPDEDPEPVFVRIVKQ